MTEYNIDTELDLLYERKDMLHKYKRDFDEVFNDSYKWLLRCLQVQHDIDVLEAKQTTMDSKIISHDH